MKKPSVTELLQLLDKPALIQWAEKKRVFEYRKFNS